MPTSHDMAESELAGRLRSLRDKVGLTQEEVAKRGDLPRTAYVFLETGRNQASTLRILKALARAFRIPLPEMISFVEGVLSVDEAARFFRDPSPTREEAARCYENIAGWAEAAAEVTDRGYVPPYAVQFAGKMPVGIPLESVTPTLVFDLATVWLRHAPLELRIAAEKADMEEERAEYLSREEGRRMVARSGEVPREEGAPRERLHEKAGGVA